jgi:hypothetical protein
MGLPYCGQIHNERTKEINVPLQFFSQRQRISFRKTVLLWQFIKDPARQHPVPACPTQYPDANCPIQHLDVVLVNSAPDQKKELHVREKVIESGSWQTARLHPLTGAKQVHQLPLLVSSSINTWRYV